MSNHVETHRNGPVGEILLNRPDKLNAITPSMARLIRDACQALDDDDAVRVVLLHGSGESAFCAGSDIKALDEYESTFHFRNRLEYATQVRNLRKPCVVALKGWTLGGGFELALSADLRVASRTASLGAPEVGLGWVGGGGASQMLPRLIGYGKAMQILLTGEPVDAEVAHAIGLVEYLVDEGQELEAARRIAGKIAEHSLVATQTVKAAVRSALSTPLTEGLKMENELVSLAFALGNDQAGRDAFGIRDSGTEIPD